MYAYALVIVGQEYLRLPGNVERFFPLLLAVFVLAEAAVVLGWRSFLEDLPFPGPALRRACALALFLVALFLVVGLHLRTMLSAWQDPARLPECVSSPTPFWLVKVMDLGVVVPGVLLIAVGLIRAGARATRPPYLLLTGYTGLAASVTAMAVLMNAWHDPDISIGLDMGFAGLRAGLRPPARPALPPPGGPGEEGTKDLRKCVTRPCCWWRHGRES